MTNVSQRRRVCALVCTLGLTIATCMTQGRHPNAVSLVSRSLAAAEVDATTRAVQTNSGELPLSFEANHGQSDAPVRFLSHRRGYTVSLAPTEALITLPPPRRSGRAAKRTS